MVVVKEVVGELVLPANQAMQDNLLLVNTQMVVAADIGILDNTHTLEELHLIFRQEAQEVEIMQQETQDSREILEQRVILALMETLATQGKQEMQERQEIQAQGVMVVLVDILVQQLVLVETPLIPTQHNWVVGMVITMEVMDQIVLIN